MGLAPASAHVEASAEGAQAGTGPVTVAFVAEAESATAGIVGVKKYAYDIWGDTVNIAARMEQNSEVGKINISGSTYALVRDEFHCIPRGKIAAKNTGDIDMYFVEQKPA